MMKQLLIVEDDLALNAALTRAMRRNGFQVCNEHDIQSALLSMELHQFDYALIDLKIGHGSGLDLIPALLSHNQRIKTIILTGYSSIATAVDAIKLGALNYLCKPASTQQILAAFRLGPKLQVSSSTAPPSVARVEWEHIQQVLANNDNNISATARELGMHRRTLQRKLQKRPVQR